MGVAKRDEEISLRSVFWMSLLSVAGELRAGGADAEHGKVIRAELESQAALRAVGHRLEEVLRGLDGVAADFAHEVAVRLGGQVVRRGAVPQMVVDDDAEALELLQVPVDSRRVDVWRQGPDRDEQLLGRRVAGALDQRREHQASSRGHPRTAISQLCDELIDSGRGHTHRISARQR
jgi:hypothetical protein